MGVHRGSRGRWYRNLFLTFLVSGIWHGANWTFVAWGALNGGYLIMSDLTRRGRARIVGWSGLGGAPRLHAVIRLVTTFALICFAWVFFRANTVGDALYVATHLLRNIDWPAGLAVFPRADLIIAMAAILFVQLGESLQARGDVRALIASKPTWLRWSVYYAALAVIFSFGKFSAPQPFIYFQF